MPTFKHPCPYCDKFIDRAVSACPYCGQLDPFAPKRCQLGHLPILRPVVDRASPGCGRNGDGRNFGVRHGHRCVRHGRR
jgi:hypothetical protein